MEGPLSKWTNVIEGWQYRWFVLDEQAGVLSYYTSKDKMIKGQRRGCVRLKGAVVGIDDEDDSTFTITVDQKMFHFQARDAEERDRWIRALEIAINRRSGYRIRGNQSLMASAKMALSDFERRISEADAYLQLMINQIKILEEKQASTEIPEEKSGLQSLIESANAMLESVKHSIVLLQIAKSQIVPQHANVSVSAAVGGSGLQRSHTSSSCGDGGIEQGVEALPSPASTTAGTGMVRASAMIPVRSYSSSDDEPYVGADINGDGVPDDEVYFDTVEYTANVDNDSLMTSAGAVSDDASGSPASSTILVSNPRGSPIDKATALAAAAAGNSPAGHAPDATPDFGDEGTNFDAIYEDDSEDELENVQEHGSVVMHLLSQLSVGMDLTKITLPTFILERRSLLEMFADFFAHPDLFANIAEFDSPEDRMTAVVKWYLSSFHAGRKSAVAKKPYNPILGETFHCRWDVPEFAPSEELERDGSPFPGARRDQLTFIAEQVSHHPPVSAFYAELPTKRLKLAAHIWTKSKFLGLSIAVHMVGQAYLSVLDYDEEYVITFPSGYGRSILTTPWVELVGKCTVKCEKTGYHADIDFLSKPFYGGRAHCIKVDAYRPATSPSSNKNPYLTVRGQWNGVMNRKTAQGTDEVFLDVHRLPIVKKQVQLVAQQGFFESRRLWRSVTAALKRKDVQKATKAKQWLEQRQRNEAKERLTSGKKWETKHFQESGEQWIYRWPLEQRHAPATSNT